MKHFFLSTLSTWGFYIAVFLLLTVGVLVTLTMRSLVESNESVTHTLVVLDKLSKTLTLIIDAETGQRGYIITGEEQYLEPYHTAMTSSNSINKNLQELRELTSNNPDLQNLLDSLEVSVTQKVLLLQEGIFLRQNIGFDAAQKAIFSQAGKNSMDKIRLWTGKMEKIESGLLVSRTETALSNLHRTIFVILSGAGFSLLFLILSFFLLHREVKVRQLAEVELLASNKELDKHVVKLAEAKTLIEQQLNRLKSLHTIDMAILGSTDYRLALKTVLEEVTQRLHADLAVIYLFSNETLMLTPASVLGNKNQEITRFVGRLGEGVIGKAAQERTTISIPKVIETKASVSHPKATDEEGIQSTYATPLIAKGILVGVLKVSFRTPYEADADWISFYEALAAQAAMAVESGKSSDDLQRSHINLKLAYDTTIEGWSKALDLRDKETEGHSQRVTDMTLKLARIAGMTETEQAHIRRGALLHDIGKMGVPDNVLQKPDRLNDEELAVMRMHPAYAHELLSPIAYLAPSLDIPYCHHEKWDGTGYPNGLKGEEIPLSARHFAIVDVWDALRSDRVYRKGWSDEKVLDLIKAGSGTHFDPRAVDLFLNVIHDEADKHQKNHI
ncbi:MAG: CHASE3 domain-containing protein [Bacteroidetes bacterium]|nr:CHASE3 domain-containing protein [Bacteroidota bacterium]